MNKLVREIITKYQDEIEANLEDSEKYWFAVQQAGAYKVGDYAKMNIGGFSLKKAFDSIGVKEDTWDFFNADEQAPNTALAVSRTDWMKFAVNPVNTVWEFSILHEAGHLFLNHGAVSQFDILLGAIDTFEMEAEIFTYLAYNKLGLRPKPKFTKLLVNNVKGYNSRGVPVDEPKIRKAVDQFLQAGGWTGK